MGYETNMLKTPHSATAVKYSGDRLLYGLTCTDMLPAVDIRAAVMHN